MNKTLLIENFKKLWPFEEWIVMGFFTENYLQSINPHWLQFVPPAANKFYLMAILYIIIMSIGVFGNALVIFLYIKCKHLKSSGNALIVNLAVSDGLMMLKMPLFIFNCFYKGPAFGDIFCRLYGFFGGLTGTVSICTLAAISLDRYYVIKFPLSRKFTNLRIKWSIITSWLYGLIFSIIPALDIGLGRYTYEGYLTSCSFDYLTENSAEKVFILIFFVAAWLVPFSVITFSYVNIVQVVLKRSFSSSKKERESFRHVKQEDKNRQEFKLAMIVLCVIFLWTAAWTPYSIVALLGVFGRSDLITPVTSMVPALFCKTASAVDPFVYAISHPKFRKELKKLVCKDVLLPTTENRRVWTTDQNRPISQTITDDVEVEFVDIELSDIYGTTNKEDNKQDSSDALKQARQIKKESSISQLLCMRPSFSNKSSSFRKIARRWSMKERERKNSDPNA